MVTSDIYREPSRDRILDSIGGAFSMGVFGGSAVHFFSISPRGDQFAGGSQAMRIVARPVAGGIVWGVLFSTFDCSLVYMRHKEDPWNSIIAGATTGGLLQIRQGLRASARSALIGGAFLGLIEGASIMLNKSLSAPQGEPGFVDYLPPPRGEPIFVDDLPGRAPQEEAAASWSSWFGGLFEGGKEEEKKSGGGKL